MPTDSNHIQWSAAEFFRSLTDSNILAKEIGAVFCQVSGLEGFYSRLKNAKALVAVSDISQGRISIDVSPRTTRVKCVYLAMRHPVDDMAARQRCLDTLAELFRQFMTVLIREKVRLRQSNFFIDQDISFTEIDRYFFSGMACAYFQITTTTFTNLVYDSDEWEHPMT